MRMRRRALCLIVDYVYIINGASESLPYKSAGLFFHRIISLSHGTIDYGTLVFGTLGLAPIS